MKNIILLTGEENIQFDTLEELKEYIIPNWSEISKKDIEKELYEKVFGLCQLEKLQIASHENGVYGDNYQINNAVIPSQKVIWIDSIEAFLLSLCQHNLIMILEKKENRCFTVEVNVEIPDEDNYLIVNAYADDILKKLGSGRK